MEKLKIFNNNSKDDNLIGFDEMLEADGNFVLNHNGFFENKDEIKLLDYQSSLYEYYIHEAKDGEHTIYRSKKWAKKTIMYTTKVIPYWMIRNIIITDTQPGKNGKNVKDAKVLYIRTQKEMLSVWNVVNIQNFNYFI